MLVIFNYQQTNMAHPTDNILSNILRLSNLDYCQSAGDMQDALQEIHDLISDQYPELEEADDEADDDFNNV